MAYQDDFRNKVLAALKAKNLAVDISQEATQQAIVEEAQIVAKSEPTAMSAEDMTQVLQDIAKQLAQESGQAFTAQSADFTAFKDQLAGGGAGSAAGSYSGGGTALSTANKDIMIIPAAGALGAAGTANTVNSLSQIDFKFIANANAYAALDPNEIKSSIYNWAERITGNTFDTPVLGFGGAWGGNSYAPAPGYGFGTSQGSSIGASINFDRGFGQIIYLKPATSTIYASLYNDVGLDTSASQGNISITGYSPAVPGSFPTVGLAVTFGGTGGSGNLLIQGAALRTQGNTLRIASSFTVSNATVTDSLTLGMSSQAFAGGAQSVFYPGGTGQTTAIYVLSAQAPSFSLGDLFYAAGTGHTTLARLTLGANNTYLAVVGGLPQWTNTISATTVAVNAATGSTILYPLLNNLAGAGSAVSTDIDFNVDPAANILRYATGSFYVGTAVSSPLFTSSSTVALRNGVNSTTGIQLQNLAGSAILTVDTTNNRVGINMTPGTFALDVTGSANLSSGNAYNIAGTSVLNATTLGSNVTLSSLTQVGTISTGVWSATAITSFYGGTGFQTYTTGDLLVGAGATLTKLPIGTTNQVLLSNGTTAVWQAATGLTVGTSNQITIAQTNVAPTLYPLFANATTGAIGASIDLDILYSAAQNILTVPNVYSGTAVSSALFTSGAGVTIRNGANSTTGIQLQNLAGTAILTVDTTNSRIGINMTPGLFALDVTGSANLSSGNAYNIAGTSVLNATTLGSNVTISSLTQVGTISTGRWQGTAVGTTYGGTGSNLGSATGSSNKVIVTGTIENGYAATLIDGANSGYLLAANGNGTAPSFVNSTSAAFTFSSGALTINNAVITSGTVANTPTNATDLVNKSYADSLSGGLDPHASVRLTTISAIGGSYRQSGTAGTLSGFGDYIIATTTAELIGLAVGFDTPVSGIALTNGQRVLIKDGVTGGYASGNGAFGAFPTTYGGFAASWVANGIYTVTSYGGAATSGWLLTRATDTDNQNAVQELTGGTFTFVEEGTNFADNGFVCTNDTTILGPIGFGSTQVSWSAFSGGAALINGQGISKTGNTIATNFNLAQVSSVNANLSNGFLIGGARSGSVGSSSYATFTVTGSAALSSNTFTANTTGFTLAGGQTNTSLVIAGVAANNTITGNADGWTHSGGTTSRTLTVTGSDITLTGGGFTLTLGSNSTASFNGQTLTLTSSMGNVTFAGSANPTATTQTVVASGLTQYQLSSQTNTWAAGDMYYMSGTAFTALTRLALGSGTGSSVLIRSTNAPVWGTINLASTDFVSGILALSSGGTNANLTAVAGGAVYSTSTALAITAAGLAGSVFISNAGNAPSWQVLNLTNSNSITGVLGISNGGTNATATPTQGGVAYGTGTAYAFTSAGTAGQAFISNGTSAPTFGTLTLAGGGTSNTASGANVAWQLAAYNSVGSGISGIAQPTASNSVLIQAAANNTPTWSNGPLAIAYGGSNATASNFTANGVVIYDSANTRLTSATGLTMTSGTGLSVTGTIQVSGAVVASGFNIAGNSVVTSVTPVGGSAIYGGVGISVLNLNPAGALSISGSGQTIIINGPGTGITGTGAATQVAYYNAARELTGSTFLTYSPTAATGVGLSVGINATSGTILQVSSNQTLTSGLLFDVDNLNAQRFTIDFKGMTSITVGSGNTGLIVSGGRSILSAATANYATVNLPSSSGTNPGAGITQVGDLWFNGTNLYFRRDATTNFDLLVGSVSGSGTANKVAKWSTSTALTDSNITDAGVGMTITSTSSVGAGGGSTAVLTLQTVSTDNSLTDRYFLRGVTSGGLRLFSIDTAGNLRATTKSFDIPHPTKEGLRLVYGVLEGPEHGVYHRGTVEGKGVIQVNLPEYWHKLVGNQYTIQLTPWGNYNVSIDSKTENYFTIQLVGDFISRKFKNIKVDFIVHGSRLDAPLNTEQ